MRLIGRIIGFLLLAAGFVALVLDGTRAIAEGRFSPMPLGGLGHQLFKERFLLLQPGVERHLHPALWQYVIQPLLELPAFPLLGLLGLLLLFLSRPKAPGIGHAPR